MITYNFHISDNPYAKAIRTYSKYSHVSIEFMGNVYEAVILDKKTRKGGVIKTPVELFNGSTVVKSVSLEVLYPDIVHKFLEAQVGKGYDIMGVLSFIWRFLPDRIGKWYCSEYATVSLAKARGIEEYSQKQTPEQFYYLTQWSK
jgi:hypothetical protein